MPEVAIIVAIAAVVVTIRLFAGRRLLAGDGRMAWIVFAPTLAITAAILVIGLLGLAGSAALVAIPLAGGSLVLLVVWLRSIAQLRGRIQPGQSRDARMGALIDAMVEPFTVSILLVLVGALVFIIGMVIWAALHGGHL
jgi:hypothetical protein